MRVLVVEDETLLSQQLASALGDAGYAVDCAADGERADFLGQTEQLRRRRPRSRAAEYRRPDRAAAMARRRDFACRCSS